MAKTITVFRKFGHGIVDKDNQPWWDEACVCRDRGPLEETVKNLNDDPGGDPRCPYRVVELRFRGARRG